jgi:hypothetical protein
MIRQYGKIILLASMILMNSACVKSATTQSEDFRPKDSEQLGGDGGS